MSYPTAQLQGHNRARPGTKKEPTKMAHQPGLRKASRQTISQTITLTVSTSKIKKKESQSMSNSSRTQYTGTKKQLQVMIKTV